MMLIDIPTVYLLTAFSSLLGCIVLMRLRGDYRDSAPALTLFAVAILALGAGFVCFGVREHSHTTAVVMTGYIAFGVSAVLIWQACARLFGVPARPGVATLSLVVYVAGLSTIHEPSAEHAVARIAMNSAFMIVFLGLSARQAHRSRWIAMLRSVRLLRNVMLFFCGVFAIRVLAFLAHGIPLHADGSAPPTVWRLSFAMLTGTLPFSLTVVAFTIANSQLSVELRKSATTDELTGLLTRRWLLDAGSRLLENTSAKGCIALLMIDLDNFKAVNDKYGHGRGDEALRHVASVLRNNLRPGDFIARYGGDEFCALAPVRGEAAAFVVAERVRAAMEAQPFRIDGEPMPITLSIGVTIHRNGDTLRQTIDEADRRAYSAKSGGRNRVVAEDEPEGEPEDEPEGELEGASAASVAA